MSTRTFDPRALGLLCAGGGFWATWLDLTRRLWAAPESLANVAALGLGFYMLSKHPHHVRTPRARPWLGVLAVALPLVHALTSPLTTPMMRCAIALTSVASYLCWWRAPERKATGFLLVFLGIPMLSQLEHYFAFPLRLLAAEGAAGLLRFSGLSVVTDGTRLVWSGGVVDVDAACSGLRSLWSFLLVATLLGAHFRLNAQRTVATVAGALVLALLGNTLRCSSLFYLESGLVKAPSWTHPATGLVLACAACYGLWELARRLTQESAPCASSSSTR